MNSCMSDRTIEYLIDYYVHRTVLENLICPRYSKGKRVVPPTFYHENNILFPLDFLFTVKQYLIAAALKAFPACPETSGLLVRKFFKGAWPLLIPGIRHPYAPSHFSFPLSFPRYPLCPHLNSPFSPCTPVVFYTPLRGPFPPGPNYVAPPCFPSIG